MPSRITVAHNLPFWLPQTSPWLYNQVKYLPEDISNLVICEWTEHLDQFPISPLHSLIGSSHLLRSFYRITRQMTRLPYSFYLASQVREGGTNIVHSHWGDVAWRARNAVRRAGAKHVVTFYGKDVNYLPQQSPIWRQRYAQLFQGVDAVLCEGPHMARCIEQLGCPAAKMHVHHLGVEVENIRYQPRNWVPGQPLKILMAASFREKKGIPDALDAIGILLRQGYAVEVTIIGGADRDPRSQHEKMRILRAIETNGLHGKVRLLGYQPYEALMRESYTHHVFISPSVTAQDGDTEGGAPVTLIDMAASGMPIVSTLHCDIPNVVLHGKTGLLAPERDPTGLAEHLRWLVDHPDAWLGILDAGRHHIAAHFDARKQAESLAQRYRQLAVI